MENLTEKEEIAEEKPKRSSFLKNLGEKLSGVYELARQERVFIYDLLLFSVGLLFSRCHIAFGAYPVAIGFIASLSFGVWGALFGAAAGALTLGRSGVIFAICSAISAFIRVIISGGKDSDEADRRIFSENLLLRMCSAVIGGFIAAVYELLLSGLNETSVLFGVSMVLLPPAVTFLFSGVFLGGYSVSALLFGSKNLLSLSGKSEKERYNIIFFEGSAVLLLFLVALSLSDIAILGISFSYIFLFFMTLLISKRFGSLRALAAGFASSLGVSGVQSVSFGLLGLVSGGLFGFGVIYGVIGGGVAAVLWGYYSSGLTGLLSVLPEYAIAASLAFPLLKKLSPETTVAENLSEERCAKDMIGTMALVYQKKYFENLDNLSSSLERLSDMPQLGGGQGRGLDRDEVLLTVLSVASDFCRVCPGRDYCKAENINPCAKNAGAITDKILAGERLCGEDINTEEEFCQYPEEISSAILRAVAKAECEKYRKREVPDSEGYELMSRLISEARGADESERAVNEYKSERLASVIADFGFGTGAGKVFGDRDLHIFVAGEDPEGDKITSEEMQRGIEEALNVSLSETEYFRKDSMVLMECRTAPIYTAEYASAGCPGEKGERSGDTLGFFKSDNGYFYSLICDGMGRGEAAAETSRFAFDFLRNMLGFSASYDTLIHLLNRSLRAGGRECSATVDLFALDGYSGEVTFIKSGAAASYVKRDSSIFRIRSKTAPLGLLSAIDTEKIKAEVRPADYVIMLSDGICGGEDDAPWLLELLSKPAKEDPREYAELILTEAKRRDAGGDDMSVAVLRIMSSR